MSEQRPTVTLPPGFLLLPLAAEYDIEDGMIFDNQAWLIRYADGRVRRWIRPVFGHDDTRVGRIWPPRLREFSRVTRLYTRTKSQMDNAWLEFEALYSALPLGNYDLVRPADDRKITCKISMLEGRLAFLICDRDKLDLPLLPAPVNKAYWRMGQLQRRSGFARRLLGHMVAERAVLVVPEDNAPCRLSVYGLDFWLVCRRDEENRRSAQFLAWPEAASSCIEVVDGWESEQATTPTEGSP